MSLPLDVAPSEQRSWVWPVVVIVLSLALVATLAGGSLLVMSQQREMRALESRLADVEAELAAAEAEIARLQAGGATEGDGGFGGLLDGLLDGLGEGSGGLGGLLEQFGDLDGLGDLGGLLGGGSDVFACLAGAMGSGGSARPIPEAPAPEQVAQIAERVEEIRGLEFGGEVESVFLPQAEFEAEIRDQFDEDYTPDDAEEDQRLLVALGALDPGTDLRALYTDLVSGQAAGFYSTDDQRIVVRADSGEGPLGPVEQITLAHELEHALSDERLGLPDLDAEVDADAAAASLALVEGGASLAMQMFAGSALGPGEQLRMSLDPTVADAQRQLGTYPHYLQRSLTFPYEDGLAFACSLHADGGWDAIDAAYSARPTTTAEVLFPERYGQGATAPRAFAGPPEGWSEVRTTTLGAADLVWLFEAPGDDPEVALDDPRGRAAAWDGGSLRLLTRGDDTAVGLALVQRDGEPDLCDSVGRWYRAAFPASREGAPEEGERMVLDGPEQDAVLRCQGGEVRLGIGPDADTARAAGR